MSESPDPDRLHHDALQRELQAARERRDSYQELLKDLPNIFEGRFRDRLRPLQQRNEELLIEGAALREQIRRSLPQADAKPAETQPATREPLAPAASGQGHPGHAPLAAASEAQTAIPSRPIQRPLVPGRQVDPSPRLSRVPPEPEERDAAGRQRRGLGNRPWLLPTAVALALAGAMVGLQALPERGTAISKTSPASSAEQADPPPSMGPSGQGRGKAKGPDGAAQRSDVALKGGSVRVESLEPSWLEVEATDGSSLYFGLLEGSQSFPVGEGLRMRAGRPDLIRIRWPGGSERVLGSVDDLDWKEIRAESGTG
jgi:hypothetical protein